MGLSHKFCYSIVMFDDGYDAKGARIDGNNATDDMVGGR
jgi:hypothetical protein